MLNIKEALAAYNAKRVGRLSQARLSRIVIREDIKASSKEQLMVAWNAGRKYHLFKECHLVALCQMLDCKVIDLLPEHKANSPASDDQERNDMFQWWVRQGTNEDLVSRIIRFIEHWQADPTFLFIDEPEKDALGQALDLLQRYVDSVSWPLGDARNKLKTETKDYIQKNR